MVIWITGLSGSGKTTLSQALWAKLKPQVPELVMIDGDVVRAAFGHDLGYAQADRVIQIGRIQRLAKVLSEQGLMVLVAALYANPELLDWNRKNISPYNEIYLNAPMETLRKRDKKNLYSGSTKNVVGVDIQWQAPSRADWTFDTSRESAEAIARSLIDAIPELKKRVKI